MTRQTKASLHELSKEYVEKQVQHFGVRIRKNEIDKAIQKVNRILLEMESARLRHEKEVGRALTQLI